MLFESILVFLLIAAGVFLVGVPLAKLIKMLYLMAFPPKRDPLKEAAQRLEIARKEAEAAKLNKETDKIYSRIYEEVLEEDPLEEESFRKKL